MDRVHTKFIVISLILIAISCASTPSDEQGQDSGSQSSQQLEQNVQQNNSAVTDDDVVVNGSDEFESGGESNNSTIEMAETAENEFNDQNSGLQSNGSSRNIKNNLNSASGKSQNQFGTATNPNDKSLENQLMNTLPPASTSNNSSSKQATNGVSSNSSQNPASTNIGNGSLNGNASHSTNITQTSPKLQEPASEAIPSAEPDETSVRVSLPKLTWVGFDFRPREAQVRIEIVAEGVPEFELFQEYNQKKQPEFIVRLYETSLRRKIGRDIDCSEFKSPVAYIRMRENPNLAYSEVVMTLRNKVNPRVFAENGNILLTFQIPDRYFGNSSIGIASENVAEFVGDFRLAPMIQPGSRQPGRNIGPDQKKFENLPEVHPAASPADQAGEAQFAPASNAASNLGDSTNTVILPSESSLENVNSGFNFSNPSINTAKNQPEKFLNGEAGGNDAGNTNLNEGNLEQKNLQQNNLQPNNLQQNNLQQNNLQQNNLNSAQSDNLDENAEENSDEDLEDNLNSSNGEDGGQGSPENQSNSSDRKNAESDEIGLADIRSTHQLTRGNNTSNPSSQSPIRLISLRRVAAVAQDEFEFSNVGQSVSNVSSNISSNSTTANQVVGNAQSNLGANSQAPAGSPALNSNTSSANQAFNQAIYNSSKNSNTSSGNSSGNAGINSPNNPQLGNGLNSSFKNQGSRPLNSGLSAPSNSTVNVASPSNGTNSNIAISADSERVDLTFDEAVGQPTVAEAENLPDGKVIRPVRMEFIGARLGDVLHVLAQENRINFIFTDAAVEATPVNFSLKDVSWTDALGALLETYGLGYIQLPGRVVRIDKINNLKVQKANIADIKKQALQTQSTRQMMVRLSYAKAADIQKTIGGMLDLSLDQRMKISSDQRTNTVIIEAIPEMLSKLKTVIERLDTPTPQVRISARIVEVNDEFDKEFGVSWGSSVSAFASQGLGSGSVPLPNSAMSRIAVDLPSSKTGGLKFRTRFGQISNTLNLDATLQLAEVKSVGKVLQNTSVLVADQQKAVIKAGSVDVFFEKGTDGSVAEKTVNYELKLEVTPSVAADGSVQLNLNIDADSEKKAVNDAASAGKQTKSISTSLLRKSGDTAVIGGVYSSAKVEVERAVPFFSKIPLIGWLFKSNLSTIKKRELLIFVTPTIMTSESSGSSSQTNFVSSPVDNSSAGNIVQNSENENDNGDVTNNQQSDNSSNSSPKDNGNNLGNAQSNNQQKNVGQTNQRSNLINNAGTNQGSGNNSGNNTGNNTGNNQAVNENLQENLNQAQSDQAINEESF